MRFYSYNYLFYNIAKFDWWWLIFIIFLAFCFIFTIYKYFKGHKDTKYRELAIILSLGIVILISVKISQYKISSVNDNKYRTAIHFIEVVAKDLRTDKENIYINTSASIDGALVKVGTSYYRVISGDNGQNYLLEKLEMHNPKIELIDIEVKEWVSYLM